MIHLVSGPHDSGKTSRMKAMWTQSGGDGVLSEKVFEHDAFIGYDLHLLSSGKTFPLARMNPIADPASFTFGRFTFSQNTFNAGITHIQHALNAGVTPIYIDEIGRLELTEHKGFYPLLGDSRLNNTETYIGIRDEFIPLWEILFPMAGAEMQI